MDATDNSDNQSRERFISQIKSETPADFASRNLLDRVPWLFTDRPQYIDWKAALAADLEVDPFMIIIVGSAATGYSLAPHKNFSAFSPRSDIDVAIVSLRHFDEAWRWLRELGPVKLLTKGTVEQEMLNWHRRNLVFDGAIETNKLLPLLPFGPKWASGLGQAGKREPTEGRAVNARLYRDFESLRQYHIAGIAELRIQMGSASADTPPTALPQRDGEDATTETALTTKGENP
jgi:hypothetical protein